MPINQNNIANPYLYSQPKVTAPIMDEILSYLVMHVALLAIIGGTIVLLKIFITLNLGKSNDGSKSVDFYQFVENFFKFYPFSEITKSKSRKRKWNKRLSNILILLVYTWLVLFILVYTLSIDSSPSEVAQ